MKLLVKVVPILMIVAGTCWAKVAPKVKCTPDQMRVEIPIAPATKRVYLDGLRDYPDPACRPHTDPSGTLAVLELDLRDVYRCAVTRVINKQTGKQIFYQTLVIEGEEVVDGFPGPKETRETLHVKCSILSLRNHTISRRNVLPAGFQEPEDLEITTSLTEHAPEPILGVGVRQAGKLVTGELNVSPGTPLQMEIFLDKTSAPVYGLLVTHMQVTDTNSQEETIIYNGCSVDPYLFENFNTVDGDFLSAKFRAFKFPESTYVQFKGTVNVCLDKCKGVECSDGQIGFGRRRRRSLPSTSNNSPNGLFEITITSFIKVDYEGGAENFEALFKNQTRIYKNKKLIVGNQMSDNKKFYKTVVEDRDNIDNDLRKLETKEEYTSILAENSARPTFTVNLLSLLAALAFIKLSLAL